MKRPLLDEDDHVPKKKRRCEIVTPFSNVVDLAYLYGLKMFVFDQQPFTFCMKKGMAVLGAQCVYCPLQQDVSNHESENNTIESYKKISHQEDDNYIVYAFITHLYTRGEVAHIDVSEVGDNIHLHVKDIHHLPPFCVNLLLMKDFVEDVRLDLMSRDMLVVCKKSNKMMDIQNVSCDSILNGDLSTMKRNILSLSRQTELQQFL